MSSGEAYYENEKQHKDRKGKKKTYNLIRHRGNEFQESLDFKLYDFKALQVDKGWDKLFVSVICIETGKIIAKSEKALVQNGQCHWEDSMLSTIWISNDSPQQNNEGCLLKLVVAMGSARFGILGEAIINLSTYIKSETYTASLPLKNCCHGTILQVKIQCLTTRRKQRGDHKKDSRMEEKSVGCDELDYASDLSDNTFSRSKGFSHHGLLDKTYQHSTKRRSPLAKCLEDDFDALESSFSFWNEKFPQQSNVGGLKNMNDRQDSTYSKNGLNPPYDSPRSMHSSPTSATSSVGTRLQDKMEDFDKVSNASDTTLTRSVGSSKDLLNAAQVTIELLHGEAMTWEENYRKLMIDVERYQKDLSTKSKNKKDLEKELSVSREENAGLKEEIERLTAMVKENDSKNLKLQIEEMDNIVKELKDEIKYQKGLNTDLEVKLKKTQESYIDLVFILRRLENTIEKQKMEIADLSVTSSLFQEAENSSEEEFSFSEEFLPDKMGKEISKSDVNMCTNEYAMRCLHEGIELMQEKQKNMESTIKFLEKTLMEKDQELQSGRGSMAQTLEENEAKWRNRLFENEKEIIDLEKKLSDGVHAFSNEITASTQRVQDLEAEFCEKHGESRKEVILSRSFSSNLPLLDSDNAINMTQVFLELYKQLQLSLESLKGQDSLLRQKEFINKSEHSKDEGEIDLKELTVAILYAIIMLKKLVKSKATTAFEYEINYHNELVRKRIRDDDEVTDCNLKENIFCFSSQELRNLYDQLASELTSLIKNQQVESEEATKFEPKTQVAYLQSKEALLELEAENIQLSEQIFGLEAEMKCLNQEKDSTRLALESSEAVVRNLQAGIRRLENQNESMQKKWLEAQEECSFLKVNNLNLQARNEKLIVEFETHETANGELRMQNLELYHQCSKQVDDLQHKFTSILDEIALKEKTMHAILDQLVQQSNRQNEKLASSIAHLEFDFSADKAMLQASLQEKEEKINLYVNKFENLQAEYEAKVQNYTLELASTMANHETLMVNHEKVVVLLENVKSNEEKLKSTVRSLEVELKTSELERLQATEENSILEVQTKKTEMLRDEIFVLNRSLNEAELECRKMEASYQMLSLEHEGLKAEKLSTVRKISSIEKVTSELKDCRLSKVELEEKIVQLEWDLTTKEASCHNNVQLRYDLAQMKKTNAELHRKIAFLQAENEEYQIGAIEQKLNQKEEVKHHQHNTKDSSTSTIAQGDLKLLQIEENCCSIKSSEGPPLLQQ
ncbi:PREDICTED: interaptin-like isoform X1 [Lupinus angustifolius]|uniref:interaptin-like isoform X1 n=2 Tax=Lupinus angustifolius TaxID=3871 RepID=UPI00092EDF85|nr:PREDICTED: interaptin-like isoform X1 [Lupinus angustifolius]